MKGKLGVQWNKIFMEIFRSVRVVKSSRLVAKIAAYLASTGRLLCLAFLCGWRFLNKLSLDWLLSLTVKTDDITSSKKDVDLHGWLRAAQGEVGQISQIVATCNGYWFNETHLSHSLPTVSWILGKVLKFAQQFSRPGKGSGKQR